MLTYEFNLMRIEWERKTKNLKKMFELDINSYANIP